MQILKELRVRGGGGERVTLPLVKPLQLGGPRQQARAACLWEGGRAAASTRSRGEAICPTLRPAGGFSGNKC